MILSCQNISKSFGTTEILKEISFNIEDKEKVAIVGINGAGKSTLLKIIINEISADNGNIILSKGKTLGYLSQHQEYSDNTTIYQAMLDAKKNIIELDKKIRSLEHDMKNLSGKELSDTLESYTRLTHEFERLNGYAYKSEIIGVLKGLGFMEEDFEKQIMTLSGGQKTRVALGKLLLSKPDIILLDEPTNHLDMDSISWLENFLSNYNGSVLIVSHDRYFLDKIVTKVIELDHCKGNVFLGNYSTYAKKREDLRNNELKEYLNQQREIKHQEEVIAKLKSFNREKSIKRAESREKALQKIEVLDKPILDEKTMRLKLEPQIISGNDVLTITGLSKSYGHLKLFSNLDLEIKRGERVALIGKNGTGKTTILKIINKYISADTGKITLGSKVKIGYYDQEQQVLSSEKTIFEELSDAYPMLTNSRIRNILAAFLFTGEDVFKPIKSLSGGERGRVSLAKLMLSNANFLILDEPTNHLDITSKEILEEALCSYTGTLFYVSHDRYFINKTATHIIDLTSEGLIHYVGNYDYYVEKKAENTLTNQPTKIVENNSQVKVDWKKQKEEQAKERKKANDLKKLEENIAKLENEISKLDDEMLSPNFSNNSEKLLELSSKKAELDIKLSELYEKWEELAE